MDQSILLCCAGELKKAGIPFTPAVGAIFMWVDLRGALPQPSWEVILQHATWPCTRNIHLR